MHQQRLALLHVQRHRPGERAARRRVGDGELDRLDEADGLRLGEDIDLVRHRFLGEPAPVEHRHDLVADLQPLAARRHLGHHARNLGARREGEGRTALVFACNHQGRGEAHAGCLDADAHLAGLQRGGLHILELQVLRSAPLAADHGFHHCSVQTTTQPHPEERAAGPRLEGWATARLGPTLRDAALRAAPQGEVVPLKASPAGFSRRAGSANRAIPARRP